MTHDAVNSPAGQRAVPGWTACLAAALLLLAGCATGGSTSPTTPPAPVTTTPTAAPPVLAPATPSPAPALAFVSTGDLTTMREGHSATLLPDGRVLVAGGWGNGILASAELYDPASEAFAQTGSMAAGRAGHTATLLPSGLVLIAGGGNANGDPVASAELYDPASGAFTPTGAMTVARSSHTATLLGTGLVLVAGGLGGAVLSSAELYDPASGTFTPTGSLVGRRLDHTATLLADGRVLVAGGTHSLEGDSILATSELYDPANGTFSATGTLITGRWFHTATLLPDGRVLVAGGSNSQLGSNILVSAEIYDPASGTFALAGNLAAVRTGHSATLLGNGRVLVAGGSNSNGILATAELFW
jgi:hypothetical protein